MCPFTEKLCTRFDCVDRRNEPELPCEEAAKGLIQMVEGRAKIDNAIHWDLDPKLINGSARQIADEFGIEQDIYLKGVRRMAIEYYRRMG
jgi:hypothetical protein